MLTFGSLFAGIGGFDLGFERAGMRSVWQVEIDPFCQKVLAKHFPDAKRYGDIRTIETLDYVDVICGGFPCQDISGANPNGQGLDGERSGLWYEFARIIRTVKPRWVVVENVARLLSINDGRDFGIVLRDLDASGYDAEWDVLPAAAFGAPHLRERVFIVAHANSIGLWDTQRRIFGKENRVSQVHRAHHSPPRQSGRASTLRLTSQEHATHAHSERRKGFIEQTLSGQRATGEQSIRRIEDWRERCDLFEPKLLRSLNGVPNGIHRLKGLGNAVVPQIAEWIGKRIVEIEET